MQVEQRDTGRPAVDEAPRTGATRGLLQIGDVAERTGLSLRTVRHYEEVGLLPAAARSPGGFRLYTEATVERLLVVKQMKPLEFTLEQMRELLDALDELATAPTVDRERELRHVLAGYQRLTGERLDRLRQHLLGGKSLQETLDDLLL